MAVRVSEVGWATGRDFPKGQAGWTPLGWLHGSGLILHNVAPQAQPLRVKFCALGDGRSKPKELSGLETKFTRKGVVAAVSPCGGVLVMCGVRGKTGGFLYMCGPAGPRAHVVHQEIGGGDGVPPVLGQQKALRPRQLFVAPQAALCVIVSHDAAHLLVWRRTCPPSAQRWTGTWTVVDAPLSSPALAGSFTAREPPLFHASFVPAGCDGCSVRVAAAAVRPAPAAPDAAFSRFSPVGGPAAPDPSSFLTTQRYVQSPSPLLGEEGGRARRLCLLVGETLLHSRNLGRQAGPDDRACEPMSPTARRRAEAAGACPLPEGAPTEPPEALVWDPRGALLAVAVRAPQAHAVFCVPGQHVCHATPVPASVARGRIALQWTVDGVFLAVAGSLGRVALLSRLGFAVRLGFECQDPRAAPAPAPQEVEVATLPGATVLAAQQQQQQQQQPQPPLLPGTASRAGDPGGGAGLLACCTGAELSVLCVHAGAAALVDPEALRVCQPTFCADAASSARLLLSLPQLVRPPFAEPLCATITVLLQEEFAAQARHAASPERGPSGGGGGFAREIAAVSRAFAAGVACLWWMVATLQCGAPPLLGQLFEHLTARLLQGLCGGIAGRSGVPSDDAARALDAAFHLLKWAEEQVNRMMRTAEHSGSTVVTVHGAVPEPRLLFSRFWVDLGNRVVDSLRRAAAAPPPDATSGLSAEGRLAQLHRAVQYHLRGGPSGELPAKQGSEGSQMQSVAAAPPPPQRPPDTPELNAAHVGHAQYLEGRAEQAAAQYLAMPRQQGSEAAFAALAVAGQLSSAVRVALSCVAAAQQGWGETLLAVPALADETAAARLCRALGTLLAAAYHPEDGGDVAVLAAPFCIPAADASQPPHGLLVAWGGMGSDDTEAAQKEDVYYVPLRDRRALAAACAAHTSSPGGPAPSAASQLELASDLWLAVGLPLEALHLALLAESDSATARAGEVLRWQLSKQRELRGPLRGDDAAVPREQAPAPGAPAAAALQFQSYERRRAALRRFLRALPAARADWQAEREAHVKYNGQAARGGWVDPGCADGVVAFFVGEAIRTGRLSRAQRISALCPQLGVRSGPLRAAAAEQLIEVARRALRCLPCFDAAVRVDAPRRPAALIAEVLLGEGPRDMQVSREAADFVAGRRRRLPHHTALRLAAQAIGWALCVACPADGRTLGRCGAASPALLRSAMAYYAALCRGVPEPPPPGLGDVAAYVRPLRRALRYAWCAEAWHLLHAPRRDGAGGDAAAAAPAPAPAAASASALVALPAEWGARSGRRSADPQQDTPLPPDVAWCAALLPLFADREEAPPDVWPAEVAQRGCLDAVAMVGDPEAKARTLGAALTDVGETPLRVVDSCRARFRRLVASIPEEAREALHAARCAAEANCERCAGRALLPGAAAGDGAGAAHDAQLPWLHEGDPRFWDFADGVLKALPGAAAAPAAAEQAAGALAGGGWVGLPAMGAVLRSRRPPGNGRNADGVGVALGSDGAHHCGRPVTEDADGKGSPRGTPCASGKRQCGACYLLDHPPLAPDQRAMVRDLPGEEWEPATVISIGPDRASPLLQTDAVGAQPRRWGQVVVGEAAPSPAAELIAPYGICAEGAPPQKQQQPHAKVADGRQTPAPDARGGPQAAGAPAASGSSAVAGRGAAGADGASGVPKSSAADSKQVRCPAAGEPSPPGSPRPAAAAPPMPARTADSARTSPVNRASPAPDSRAASPAPAPAAPAAAAPKADREGSAQAAAKKPAVAGQPASPSAAPEKAARAASPPAGAAAPAGGAAPAPVAASATASPAPAPAAAAPPAVAPAPTAATAGAAAPAGGEVPAAPPPQQQAPPQQPAALPQQQPPAATAPQQQPAAPQQQQQVAAGALDQTRDVIAAAAQRLVAAASAAQSAAAAPGQPAHHAQPPPPPPQQHWAEPAPAAWQQPPSAPCGGYSHAAASWDGPQLRLLSAALTPDASVCSGSPPGSPQRPRHRYAPHGQRPGRRPAESSVSGVRLLRADLHGGALPTPVARPPQGFDDGASATTKTTMTTQTTETTQTTQTTTEDGPAVGPAALPPAAPSPGTLLPPDPSPTTTSTTTSGGRPPRKPRHVSHPTESTTTTGTTTSATTTSASSSTETTAPSSTSASSTTEGTSTGPSTSLTSASSTLTPAGAYLRYQPAHPMQLAAAQRRQDHDEALRRRERKERKRAERDKRHRRKQEERARRHDRHSRRHEAHHYPGGEVHHHYYHGAPPVPGQVPSQYPQPIGAAPASPLQRGVLPIPGQVRAASPTRFAPRPLGTAVSAPGTGVREAMRRTHNAAAAPAAPPGGPAPQLLAVPRAAARPGVGGVTSPQRRRLYHPPQGAAAAGSPLRASAGSPRRAEDSRAPLAPASAVLAPQQAPANPLDASAAPPPQEAQRLYPPPRPETPAQPAQAVQPLATPAQRQQGTMPMTPKPRNMATSPIPSPRAPAAPVGAAGTAPGPEPPTSPAGTVPAGAMMGGTLGTTLLTPTEERLYARYIRQLGLTTCDVVATGGSAPGTVPPPAGVGDPAAAAAAQPAQLAAAVAEAVVRALHPTAAPAGPESPARPTPRPPPSGGATVPASPPAASGRPATADRLTALEQQQQRVGMDIADAFRQSLQDLPPALADALEKSAAEGRRLERDGQLRLLRAQHDALGRMAQGAMVRPEAIAPGGMPGRPDPEDDAYKAWCEQQRAAAQGALSPGAAGSPGQLSAAPPQVILQGSDAAAQAGPGFISVQPLARGLGPSPAAAVSPKGPAASPKGAAGPVGDRTTAEVLGAPGQGGQMSFIDVQATRGKDKGTPESAIAKALAHSQLAHLGAGIGEVAAKADTLEGTLRAAQAQLESSDAAMRDAERLREQRRIESSLDCLAAQAQRIEEQQAAHIARARAARDAALRGEAASPRSTTRAGAGAAAPPPSSVDPPLAPATVTPAQVVVVQEPGVVGAGVAEFNRRRDRLQAMVDWRGEQGSAGFLWQTSSAAHPSGDPLADARLAPSTAGWDPAALATSSSSYQPTEARPEDWDQASLRELLLRADRHGTGKVSREQLLDVLRSDAEARRLLHVPGADGEASLALWAERLLRQLHIPAEGNVPLADLDLLHTPLRGPAGSPAGLGTRVQSMLSHQFSGLATPAQQAGLSAGNTPRGEYAASALARPALSGLAPSGLAPSGLAHSGLAHSMLAHKEEEDAAASAEAVASAAAAAGGSRSPPRPAALDASLVTGGGPPVGKEIEDPHYQQQQQQQPVRRKDNAPFSGHFHKRAPQRGPQRGKSAQQGGVPTAAQNPWQNAYTQPARHVQGRASSQRRPAERPAAPVPAQKAQTRKAALLDGALGREIASMQKLLDAAGA